MGPLRGNPLERVPYYEWMRRRRDRAFLSTATFGAVSWSGLVLIGAAFHQIAGLDEASFTGMFAAPPAALVSFVPLAVLLLAPLIVARRAIGLASALPNDAIGANRECLLVVASTELFTGAVVVLLDVSGAPWTLTAGTAGLLTSVLIGGALRDAAWMFRLAHLAAQPDALLAADDMAVVPAIAAPGDRELPLVLHGVERIGEGPYRDSGCPRALLRLGGAPEDVVRRLRRGICAELALATLLGVLAAAAAAREKERPAEPEEEPSSELSPPEPPAEAPRPPGWAVEVSAGVLAIAADERAIFAAGYGPGGTAWLAAFGRDGSRRWETRPPAEGSAMIRDVAVDPSGSGGVCIAGEFRDRIDLGAGPLSGSGDTDAFVACFDADGRVRWSHALGGPREDSAAAIVVDGAGNVTVAGHFAGRVRFGAQSLSAPPTHVNGWIAQFDRDARPRWARSLSGGGYLAVGDLALAGDGTIVAAAQRGAWSISTLQGDGLRLGPDGRTVWARRIRGGSEVGRIAVAPDGGVVVGLHSRHLEELAGKRVRIPEGCSELLARFDARGQAEWVRPRRPGTLGGLVVGADGMIWIAVTERQPPGQTIGAFVTQLSADGAERRSILLSGRGRASVTTRALALSGGAVVAEGSFFGTADLFVAELTAPREAGYLVAIEGAAPAR